jgi:oligoendopeptidase F
MIDIDEIHSQSDELLFMPYYKEIYGEDAYKTISKYELNSNLGSIVSGCVYDKFEQAVFAGDYDSVDELNELYASICTEYGLTSAADYGWTIVQHLFLYPFYYISYAVSLIPSLEIYSASLEDREKGIDMYNDLFDGTIECTGFIDLMNKSGFDNPFEEETIAGIAEKVKTIFG